MAKFLDYDGLLYFWQQLKGKFVAQESGKGLSTNDFTTTEKNKLAGIAAGAEVNVNADWNATSGDAQILHKPSIPTKTSDITNDSGFITSASVPSASSTTPKMDGTAAVGTGTTWARADHVHPHDTSKVDKTTTSGNATTTVNNSNGSVLLEYSNDTQDKHTSVSTSNAFSVSVQSGTALTQFAMQAEDVMINANGTGDVYIKDVVTPTDNKDAANKKYVDDAVATKQNTLTFDTAPTANSTNPVTSGGIKTYVDEAIGSVTGIDFQIVTQLPQTGTKGVIYLVSNGGSSGNSYDEYIWVSNAFEKIGTTDVDLSNYWNTTNLTAITNTEIDTIMAA